MNKTRIALRWFAGTVATTALVVVSLSAPAHAADTGWGVSAKDTGWGVSAKDTGWGAKDTGWGAKKDTGWG